MNECICSKEGKIAKMEADMETIKHVVLGNGKEGLNVSVPILAKSVEDLQSSIEKDREVHSDMKTALRGLLRHQDDLQIIDSYKEEYSKKRDRKLLFFMTIIVTIVTVTTFIVSQMI